MGGALQHRFTSLRSRSSLTDQSLCGIEGGAAPALVTFMDRGASTRLSVINGVNLVCSNRFLAALLTDHGHLSVHSETPVTPADPAPIASAMVLPDFPWFNPFVGAGGFASSIPDTYTDKSAQAEITDHKNVPNMLKNANFEPVAPQSGNMDAYPGSPTPPRDAPRDREDYASHHVA